MVNDKLELNALKNRIIWRQCSGWIFAYVVDHLFTINGTIKMNSIKQHMSAQEWQLRVDLAACYRAVVMCGWLG